MENNNNAGCFIRSLVALLIVFSSHSLAASESDQLKRTWYEMLVLYFNEHLAPESPGYFYIDKNDDDQYAVFVTDDLMLNRTLNLTEQAEVDSFFGLVLDLSEDNNVNRTESIFISAQPGFPDTQLLNVDNSLEIPDQTEVVLDLQYLPSNQHGCYSTGFSIDGVDSSGLLDIVLIPPPLPLCADGSYGRQVSGKGPGGRRGSSTGGVQRRQQFGRAGGGVSFPHAFPRKPPGDGADKPPSGGGGKKNLEPGSQKAFERLQTLIRQLARQRQQGRALNGQSIITARRLLAGVDRGQLKVIKAMPEYESVKDLLSAHEPVFE